MRTIRRPAEAIDRGQAAGPTRRGFLRIAGAMGVASLAAVPRGASSPLSADERRMILQVARAGAVFPIDFPSFGEYGPSSSRATATRLRGAVRRASRSRLALARAGSDVLIAQHLLDQPRARLLDGIGRLASERAGQREVTATVALAIATVSRHFDPESDEAARRWIGGLRELRRRAAIAGRDSR